MLYKVENGHGIDDVSKDVDMVTMGINPSRPFLHEGHYLTMYQALKAMHKRPKTKGLIFVDDREFDFARRAQHSEDLISMPKYSNGETIQVLIRSFVDNMSQALGDSSLSDRVTVQRMSEWYGDMSAFGLRNGYVLFDLLERFRTTIDEIFEFHQREQGMQSVVRPVCHRCHCAERVETKTHVYQGKIHAICMNNHCPKKGKMYVVDVPQGDPDWSIHYAVDPVRDTLLAQQGNAGVLHVFGGDYGLQWGDNGRPKATRMQKLVNTLVPDIPIHHYVGPLLTRNGQKLAKSHDNWAPPPTIDMLEEMLSKAKIEMNLPVTS